MPRWTEADLKAYEARRAGLCPVNSEPTQGDTLVGALPREEAGGLSSPKRYHIIFRIFSVRPADWDGYSVKELQDLLIVAGMLPDDKWSVLQGEVVSEKVHSKAEERTEIEII